MHSELSLKGEKCLCSPVTLLTVLRVCVCPYAQCLHRCMDNSECPDKNRLPGDVSPAGAHWSRPRIGQESHSSTSYHALHSLFPKALATSWLNLTCLWPLGCSLPRRDARAFFSCLFYMHQTHCQTELELSFGRSKRLDEIVESMMMEQPLDILEQLPCDAIDCPPHTPPPTSFSSTVHNGKHDPNGFRDKKKSKFYLHKMKFRIAGRTESS